MNCTSCFCCSVAYACNAIKSCTEKSPKALLIEDDEIISGYLRYVLNKAGCCVICASNADQGLDFFYQNSKLLDFIIMDYQMPGMHAARLVSRIRDISSNINIILASGYTEDFISNDFPLELVTSFIQKPFEAESLLEMIASQCRKRS